MADCTIDTLAAGSACINQLSETEKLAAEVYYLCLAQTCVATPSCDVDTIAEAMACIEKVPLSQLQSMQVYIDYLTAASAGATVTGTITEIKDGIKCLKFLSPAQLRALITLFRCRISECVQPLIT